MATNGEWAREFAIAVGNPSPNQDIIKWISAWVDGEGTSAKYNPLATTYDLPPNTKYNTHGVRNYTNRAQGIQATVKTLNGNYPGYSDIKKGIINNDPKLAQDGLMRAPWGTNGTRVGAIYLSQDASTHILKSEPFDLSKDVMGNPNLPDNPNIGTDIEKRVNEAIDATATTMVPGYAAMKTIGDFQLWAANPDNRKRLYQGIAGIMLISSAIIIAIGRYVDVGQVIQLAGNVTPVGKAASIATKVAT